MWIWSLCTIRRKVNLSRDIIISRALFCPVYQIFDHAAKHTHHLERTLKSRPRLRESLSKWTYIPDTQTDITTTKSLLTVLQQHPAQNIYAYFSIPSNHNMCILLKRENLMGVPTQTIHSPLSHTHCITWHEHWAPPQSITTSLTCALHLRSNIHDTLVLWQYSPVPSLRLAP